MEMQIYIQEKNVFFSKTPDVSFQLHTTLKNIVVF